MDVGCGTGKTAFAIAKRGGRVLGIDYSKEAVRIAKNCYNHPRLQFQCLDIQEIKGRNLFDVIIILGTLEHMDYPLDILKQLKGLLRKHGLLIVTCPCFTNLRGYVLMTLYYLFKAPISLTDIHNITPLDMMDWAKKLRMSIEWRTFDYNKGNKERMIEDLKDRLPKALGQAKMETKNIKDLISWLEKIMALDHQTKHSGAIGLYKLTKK